jgi:hypothetical protein
MSSKLLLISLLLGIFSGSTLSFLHGFGCVERKATTLSLRSDEYKKRKQNAVTIKDLVSSVAQEKESVSRRTNGKNKSRRVRARAENPKQQYMYASQRKKLMKKKSGDDVEEMSDDTKSVQQIDKKHPITIARSVGLNPALQTCDASYIVGEMGIDSASEPRIVGQVRLTSGDNESESERYAYVIDKPAGWSILDKKKKNKSRKQNQEGNVVNGTSDGNVSSPRNDGKRLNSSPNTKLTRVKYYDEEAEAMTSFDYDPLAMLSVMTPDEIAEFELEGGIEGLSTSDDKAIFRGGTDSGQDNEEESDSLTDMLPVTKSDSKSSPDDLSYSELENESRPSVVGWLKMMKASEGSPIRGGKNWKAMAGAVDVDDSGLVVLCPKTKGDDIFVDHVDYIAVVGNGNYVAPKGKRGNALKKDQEAGLELKEIAKLRKARGDDVISIMKIHIPDGFSTCNEVVHICQKEYLEGIRGDPTANPFDRRATRRLIHCSSLSLSSLSVDDFVECNSMVPDDIQILADRRNNHGYKHGSFLGRMMLKNSGHTNAYREINGAADGFPGWIVDRYDKWLLVQHDEKEHMRGPLPSLHDGNTAGIYYFKTNPDRSVSAEMGVKPILIEGQPAPDTIPIKENGITYLVNFEDFSTGIFLDQRLQRAWLAKHCTPETRVLNCFAHCGGFSIAAATAGAETVSLDLEQKWLNRIGSQLEANGIEDNSRHDRIYGDCKYAGVPSSSIIRYWYAKLSLLLFPLRL